MSATSASAGGAALAGLEVHDLDAAAVGGRVDVLAVERQVEEGSRAAERVDRRARAASASSIIAGGAFDDLRRAVDGGAGAAQMSSARSDGKRTPTVSMTCERRFVDPRDGVGVEDLDPDAARRDRR